MKNQRIKKRLACDVLALARNKKRRRGYRRPRRGGALSLQRKQERRRFSNFSMQQQPRELRRALRSLLLQCIRLDRDFDFLEPVDTEVVPDYLSVVPYPMDFRSMEVRVFLSCSLGCNELTLLLATTGRRLLRRIRSPRHPGRCGANCSKRYSVQRRGVRVPRQRSSASASSQRCCPRSP